MEHLNTERIFSYIENQMNGREAAEVEAHLATCQRCYESYAGMRSVGKILSRSFSASEAADSCPDDWEIGAFTRRESASEVTESMSNHIKECGFCIDRAAIYYKALETEELVIKTPELWKQKAIQKLKSEDITQEPSISCRIAGFFRNITVSLPPWPGYAVAGLAIALLIISNIAPQKEKIVTIASSERITTRDSEIPSSFGFMGSDSREVKHMEISYTRNNIEFKWRPVAGAVDYEFVLQDKSLGKKIYSGSINTNAQVFLKKDLFERNRLYRWVITGKMTDGKYFEYTGDFLISK